MKRDSRLRRVEEVERVARRRRIEHQQVVARPPGGARGASPSPCTPASPRRRSTARGRSGSRTPRRASRRRARCARPDRRRCAWRRASSPTARPSPPPSPAAASRSGSTRCSSLPSSGEPERVGQSPRRVDRQHGDALARARPCRRRSWPTVVVLPTPPDPAQMTISLRSIRSSTVTQRRPAPRRGARGPPARPRGRAGSGGSGPRRRARARSRSTCSRCSWACSCAVSAAAMAVVTARPGAAAGRGERFRPPRR